MSAMFYLNAKFDLVANLVHMLWICPQLLRTVTLQRSLAFITLLDKHLAILQWKHASPHRFEACMII